MQRNKNHADSDSIGLRKRNMEHNSGNNIGNLQKKLYQDNPGGDSENKLQMIVSSSSNYDNPKNVGVGKANVLQEASPILETADDSTIPTEVSSIIFS